MNSILALLPDILWICLTLLAYAVALKVHRLAAGSPILHPLVITSALVFVVLHLSGTTVPEYRQHGEVLNWLLGPATVALAVPLFNQLSTIRKLGYRAWLPVLFGGVLAPVLAVAVLWLTDTDWELIVTMLVKSITTPLAIEVARISGGIPGLAAGFVIITGIVGAVAARWIFSLTRVSDPVSQGLALGTVSHAVGTAQAIQMNPQSGAFATLALCLNGILTAMLLPLLLNLIN